MGYINLSDTKKEIRHIIKHIRKNKKYEIISISDIQSNKKNPKYCHVTVQYRKKQHQARARPGLNKFVCVN